MKLWSVENKMLKHANPPSHCDLCDEPITTEFSDARIIIGGQRRWAEVCPRCAVGGHALYGTGQGQRFVKNGQFFVKVQG
jgi:hypothetical protein